MNNSTATPNRNLNQIINDGDLSSLVKKNQNLLIAGIIVVVLAVIGFGLYTSYSDKSKADFNSKIYSFENTVLKDYNDKSNPQTLVDGIKNLHTVVGNYAGLVPVIIKVGDKLMTDQHLDQALEVLTVGLQASKNDYSNYFILSRLAVVYEDLGKTQAAIDTLDKMNSQSLKIFEGKNYLDLGRLYLKLGNKEKARASFTFVVEKTKDESEFVKIAKLYLAKI